MISATVGAAAVVVVVDYDDDYDDDDDVFVVVDVFVFIRAICAWRNQFCSALIIPLATRSLARSRAHRALSVVVC